MLSTIKHKRDVIASEAFSISSVSELARRIIPNLITDMTGFMSSLISNQPAVQLSSNQKAFIKEVPRHSYMDLAPLIIYVPEGLDVKYSEYQEHLSKSIGYSELLMEELNNYTTFISRLINNTDDIISTDYAKSKYDSLNKELDAVIEGVSKCFKKNSTNTEKKFGQMVSNNNEWKDVIDTLGTIVTRTEAIKNSEIIKKISECTELLNILHNKIKRGEFEKISPEMTAKISEYTYVVARYLEFYSVTRFNVRVYAEAVNASVDKVMDILNRK